MRQREKVQAVLCHGRANRALTLLKSTYDCYPHSLPGSKFLVTTFYTYPEPTPRSLIFCQLQGAGNRQE
jgi:hypothetical protein